MRDSDKLPPRLIEADNALADLLGGLLTPAAPDPKVTLLPNPLSTQLKNLENAPISEVPPPQIPSIPGWAEDDFKVLLVGVGKLRFAVPLVRLNAIMRFDPEQTRAKLPWQPNWHRGVGLFREQKMVVVDLSNLIDLDIGEVDERYLLVMGEGRYGIICSELGDQLTLQSASVNWHKEPGSKDWRMGILPEQMCVLLDLDNIEQRLDAGDDWLSGT